MRLDIKVAKIYNISRNKAGHLIKNGEIYVDNIPIYEKDFDCNGESIKWIEPKINIKILWENDHIMVVHKPNNLSVCKTHSTPSNEKVLNELIPNLADSPTHPHQFGLINRLDKDTSGLIVLVKNNYMFFKQQVQNQTMKKRYFAYHQPYEAKFQFHFFKCEHGISYFTYNITSCWCIHQNFQTHKSILEGYKEAITYYNPQDGFFDCIPVTGRTHQIRLAMLHMKQPIIGDKIYGIGDYTPMGLWSVGIGLLLA